MGQVIFLFINLGEVQQGGGTDKAARSSFAYNSYLAFEETLSTSYEYRIRWNIKSVQSGKILQLKYNTVAGTNGTNIGSSHAIPVVTNFFIPGTEYTSSVFSGLNGTYHLILTTATGNSNSVSGYSHFDNYILERRSLTLSYPAISLVNDQLTVNEGQSVDVCVIPSEETTTSINLQLALFGGSSPHLDNFSTLDFVIPAQTSSAVCTTLYVDPDDGIADNDGSYTLKLIGPDTNGTTSDLDTLNLTVIDGGASITYSPNNLTISEGESGQVCFDISGPPASAISVDLVLSSTSGPHFTNYTTQTITFPSGQSQSQCIVLSPEDTGIDPDANYNYTFTPQTSSSNVMLSGTISVLVQEPDSVGCTFSFIHEVSNLECIDNNTPVDPTDDLFEFDLLVTRSDAASGAYVATINTQNVSGTYGSVLHLGPYAIANGDLTVYLADSVNNNCLDTIMVTVPISLGSLVTAIVCDDNDTPNDHTDDVFYFDIEVNRSDMAGNTWQTTIDGQLVNGSYGTTLHLGPYAISAGNLSFTIEDEDGEACEMQQSVTAPATCSNGINGPPSVVFTRILETVIEGESATLCIKLVPPVTFTEDILAEIRLISDPAPYLGNYQTQNILIEAGETNALCISVQTSFVPSVAETISEYQFVIRNARTISGDTIPIDLDSIFTLRVVDIQSPTTLYTGDIIFIGFDNFIGNERDRIVMTNLVPLGPGTRFSISNVKYCSNDDSWYSRDENDGAIASQLITYSGAETLPAGSTICVDVPGVGNRDELLLKNFMINGEPTEDFSVRNNGQLLDPDINLLTTEANDLYLMQGEWQFTPASGQFDGTVMSRLQIGESTTWLANNCVGGADLPEDLECMVGPTVSATGSLYGFFDCSEFGSSFSRFDYLALASDIDNWNIQNGTANLNLESYACDSICSLTSDSLYWMVPPDILVLNCDQNTEAAISQWLSIYGNGEVVGTCGGPITILNNYGNDLSLACTPDTLEVVFTALDTCGNRASIVGQIVIGSIAAPVFIQQPQGATIYCNEISQVIAAYQTWLGNYGGAQVNTFCGPMEIQFIRHSVSAIGCGETEVTFFAVNACGDTTFANPVIFEVIDDTAPVLDATAQHLTVNCNDADFEDQVIAWLSKSGYARATDNCSQIVSWTHDFMPGAYNCGTTMITFTGTDYCGNSVTTTANLTVEDDVAPEILYAPVVLTIITGRPDFEEELAALLAAHAYISAQDNCSEQLTWTHDYDYSLDSLNCGEVLVTFTVTDECGNAESVEVLIRAIDVAWPEIIIEPQDLTLLCDASDFTSQVNTWLNNAGGAVATDNLTNNLSWSFDILAGDVLAVCGAYPVIFTVADSCGNTSSVQASIIVLDTVPPVVSVFPDTLRLAFNDPNYSQLLADWLASAGNSIATDNCAETLSWSNDFAASTFVLNEGDSCFQQQIIFSVTDGCGNTTTLPPTILEVYLPGISLVDGGSDLELPCACQSYYPEAIAWLDNIAGIELDYCSLLPYEVSHTTIDENALFNCEDQSITFTITQPGSSNTITVIRQINMTQTSCDAAVQSAGSDLVVTCGPNNTAAVNNWLANYAGIVLENTCGEFYWDTPTVDYTALSNCLNQTVTFSGIDRCDNPVSVDRQIMVECDLSVVIEEINGQLCAQVTGYCPNTVSFEWNNSLSTNACITPPTTYSGNYQVTVTCNVGSGNNIFCQEAVSPIYHYDACGSLVDFDPQCPTNNYDVLFLLDNEKSLTPTEFDQVDAAVIDVMNAMEANSQSTTQIRYAVVAYYGGVEDLVYWISDWSNSPSSSINRPTNVDCANLNSSLGALNSNMHSPRSNADLHLVILTDSPDSTGCFSLLPTTNAGNIRTNYSATISVVRYKDDQLSTAQNTAANQAASSVADAGRFYYKTSFTAPLPDVTNDIFGCSALTASAQMNCSTPTYSWSASNGGQITGSTTGATININGEGTYAVTISCGDSCTVTGNYNFSALGSGSGSSLAAQNNRWTNSDKAHFLEEPDYPASPPDEQELQVRIFPNPTKGLLYLEILVAEDTEIQIDCFSTAGERIITRNESINKGTNRIELDGRDLPSGVYLLRIWNEQSVYNHRVIIQH